MRRLILLLPLLLAVPARPAAPTSLPVRMDSGWLRRDWRQCADVQRVAIEDGVVTFRTDRSAAMLWQVPTRQGPFAIDPGQSWARTCSRPPLSFSRQMFRQVPHDQLVSMAEFPRLAWRWQVDPPVEDRALAEPSGRIRREGDDFAAKLGVLVRARDEDTVREVAYVWTKSVPVGTVLHQEAMLLPFWRERMPRIVARAGDHGRDRWVDEDRDVAADFRRLHGMEPGFVVRLYLMSDADATGGRTTARFASLAFHR